MIRNETLFRQVNERIDEVSRSVPLDAETMEFICECGEQDCARPMALTRAEYEAVRTIPSRFAVLPGHGHPAFERIVSEGERFSVVEKIGEAQETAEATDPRS